MVMYEDARGACVPQENHVLSQSGACFHPWNLTSWDGLKPLVGIISLSLLAISLIAVVHSSGVPLHLQEYLEKIREV